MSRLELTYNICGSQTLSNQAAVTYDRSHSNLWLCKSFKFAFQFRVV